jgi:hypothetical protein
MKRVNECIVCGQPGCVEFSDKYYCFRFGVTRKKTQGLRQKPKKDTGSFAGGLGGAFSKASTNNCQRQQMLFGETEGTHLDAISL